MNINKQVGFRLLSCLFAVIMLIGMMPFAVFADGGVYTLESTLLANEEKSFTIDLPQKGYYRICVSGQNGGGEYKLTVDGELVAGKKAIGKNGAYTDETLACAVLLDAGEHQAVISSSSAAEVDTVSFTHIEQYDYNIPADWVNLTAKSWNDGKYVTENANLYGENADNHYLDADGIKDTSYIKPAFNVPETGVYDIVAYGVQEDATFLYYFVTNAGHDSSKKNWVMTSLPEGEDQDINNPETYAQKTIVSSVYLEEGTNNNLSIYFKDACALTRLELRRSSNADVQADTTMYFTSANKDDFSFSNGEGKYFNNGLNVSNKTLQFKITIPQKGYYKMTSLIFATGETYTIKIGEDISFDSKNTAIKNDDNAISLGAGFVHKQNIYLEANEYDVSIKVNGGSELRSVSFILTEYGESKAVALGDNVISNGETAPRGIDNMKVAYNYELAEDTLSKIYLYDNAGGDKISMAASLSEDKKALLLTLNETLDYNKDYSLDISGVTSITGMNVPDENITFTTSDKNEDKGTASVEITEAKIVGDGLSVSGVVKGSIGQGLKGRNVTVYTKINGSEDTYAEFAKGVSGDGGVFAIAENFPENTDTNNFDVLVMTEYDAVGDETDEAVYYVSSETREEALNELKKTETTEDVEEFFGDFGEILNIAAENTEGVTTDEFYPFLVGAEALDYPEFINLYRGAVALAKINKASDVDGVKTILETEIYKKALNIPTEKIAVLENDDKFYDALAAQKPFESRADFDTALESAFNKSLAEQEEIGALSLASISSESLYAGQEAEFIISAENEFSNIKKITLTIDLGELNGNYENILFETETGYSTLEDENGIITIEIDVEKPASLHSEIGALKFCALETGSFNIGFKGEALCGSKTDYDVVVDILEKTAELNVSKKSGGGSSGGGGSFSGGGGNVIKPSDAVINPDTPLNDESEKAKYYFNDIEKGHWAESSIYYLLDKSIVHMSPEGNFYPERNITRAEFLKMIVLSKNLYTAKAWNEFNDVSEDDWFYLYVVAGINFEIVKGDENGNFNPNAYITREDMCVMLNRLLKKDDLSKEKFADDESISSYAKEAVYAMKEAGLIDGVGNNAFAPKQNATRAMAAKLICTMLAERE